MKEEPKVNVVEVNGIRQESKITSDAIHKSLYDIETDREVLRTKSLENGSSELELVDKDFWSIIVNGEKADEKQLETIEGGPYKILILPEDKTVEIITG